jgi:hypothetical protein
MHARESQLRCRERVDQHIEHESADGKPTGLGDARLVVKQECERTAVERDVLRYRYEIDHGFVTPDWDEIARITGVSLAFEPPRCGLRPGNRISARLHGKRATLPARREADVSDDDRARELLALVRRARVSAEARDGLGSSAIAQQALALAKPGDVPVTPEVVDAIAAAQFYAIEFDVVEFLARPAPHDLDDAWALEIAAAIDRIASRYETLGDRVRHPAIARWLRAGAGKVATLHAHVATLLDSHGQARAAETARAKARELERVASQR